MTSERATSSARPDRVRLEPFYGQVADMVAVASGAFARVDPSKPQEIYAAVSLFERAALLAHEKFREGDPVLLEEILRIREAVYRNCLGLRPLPLERSAELMEGRGSGVPQAVSSCAPRPGARREEEATTETVPLRPSEPMMEERFDMGKAEEMIGSLKVRDARLGEMLASYSGLFRIRDVGLAPEQLVRKIRRDIGRLDKMMVGASEEQMRQIIVVWNALEAIQQQFLSDQKKAIGEARRRETAYSTPGAWAELVAEIGQKEGLDLREKEQFLHWFRGLVYEMLAERMGDPVDLQRYLTVPLGVYGVQIDQVLDMIETQTDFGLKEILKTEMDFLSATVIRRLKFVRTWGDLDKQVDEISHLDEEGKLVQLDAGKYHEINHFVRMTYKDERGKVVMDEVPYAERFRNAMAGYFILKRLWQDSYRQDWRMPDGDICEADNKYMGPKGKRELEKLRNQGYSDQELAFLKNPGANIFFKGGVVEGAPIRLLRAQIAMHAGGYVNPADLTDPEREIITEYESFLKIPEEKQGQFRPGVWQAWEKGRLAEMAAYNLMFASGVVSYLDTTGAGDTGFNLLMQTRRYFATQAKSSRPTAAERLIKKVDRIMPTFFEAYSLQGRSLEEWFVDRRAKYEEIPWLKKGGLPENPDRPYGVSLQFALTLFHYMRGDEFIDFGEIVQPEPGSLGSGQQNINRKIVRQIGDVWKAAFIWAAALALKNGDHRIFGEGGRHPMLDENGRPTNDKTKDSFMGLAKCVFKEMMLANLEHHVPTGLFGKLTGLGSSSLGTMLTPEDEAAIRNVFGNKMRRIEYGYDGKIVKIKGPLFTWQEACGMLDSIGAGDAAVLRRFLGAR